MNKYDRENWDLPKMEDCITHRVYKIRCRNLGYGVWNGTNGFIGIRTKFSSRYLFTEYHWDTGAPHGTVREATDISIDVPEHIELVPRGVIIDQRNDRVVAFDKSVSDGGRGWYFVDTNESDQNIMAVSTVNKALFEFLDEVEKANNNA